LGLGKVRLPAPFLLTLSRSEAVGKGFSFPFFPFPERKQIHFMTTEERIENAETRIFKAVFPNTTNHYDTLFRHPFFTSTHGNGQ